MDEGGQQEPESTIVVLVKDSDGNRVEGAKVSLFDARAYTSIDVATTNSEGVVTFAKIKVGKRVYVNAEPSTERARELNPYYGVEDAQAVRERGDTEFRVELRKKAPTEVNTLSVKVLDETGKALEGATVRLRAMGTSVALGPSQLSKSDGTATFTLAPGVIAYATAWKQGYLPERAVNLKAGDTPQIQLAQAIVGNYGDLEVTVRDADGQLVPAARVRLEGQDGFDLGLPEQDTGGDGLVLFSQVPAGVVLRAVGSLGSLKGASDVFTVSFSEVGEAAKEVLLQLEPSFGDILATAEDVSQPGRAVQGASFVALEKGTTPIANCTSTGSSCVMRVRAGREVVVQASASGYAPALSAPLYVAAENRKEVKVFVLPADLATQLRVQLMSVKPLTGIGGPVQDQLERGTPYEAEFFFNHPSSERAGVFVRLGDAVSVGEDLAGLGPVFAPPGAEIVRTSTYNPSTGCLGESTEPVDNAFKAVSVEFRNRTQASASLKVRFFVKPTAQAGARVSLYFRAWASRGAAYTRDPADPVLGTARSVPQRQECYAESKSKFYTVSDGGSACNEKACLSVLFVDQADPTLKGGRGYVASYNEPFKAQVNARAFVALEPSSTYVKISNDRDRNVRFGNEYEARVTPPNVPAQPPVNLLVEFGALPVLPAPTTKIFVEFGDARGPLVQDEYEIRVDGKKGLTLVVNFTPTLLQANEEQDFRVNVRTQQGTPVEKARIELLEGKGAPFNGQPPARLEGDGSEDNGLDGRYVFKRLSPVAPGEVLVRVTTDPKGLFKISETKVPVAAFDFLEFAPEAVAISGGACNQSVELNIQNPLQSDVLLKYAFVGEAPCVDVFAAGPWQPGSARTVKKSTAKRAGGLKVQLKPAANRNRARLACTLSFEYFVAGQPGFVTTDVVVPAQVDCPIAVPVSFQELPPGFRPCVEDQDEACGGEYAPDGVCRKNRCDCGPGANTTSCDVQDNFGLLQQCKLNVQGRDYGYPISPNTGQPSSCIAGQCEVGVCSCREALVNKFADLLFNKLWWNYMASALSEERVQFKDAEGGFIVQFDPGSGGLAGLTPKPYSALNQELAAPGAAVRGGPGYGVPTTTRTPTPSPGPTAGQERCGADLCFSVSGVARTGAFAVVLDNSGGNAPARPFQFTIEQPQCWKVITVPTDDALKYGLLKAVDVFGWLSGAARLTGLAAGQREEVEIPRSSPIGGIRTELRDHESAAYWFEYDAKQCAPGGVLPGGATYFDYILRVAQEGRSFEGRVRVFGKSVPREYMVPVVPGTGSQVTIRESDPAEPFSAANNVLGTGSTATITVGGQTVNLQPGQAQTLDSPAPRLSRPANTVAISVAGTPLDPFSVQRKQEVQSLDSRIQELAKYDVVGGVTQGATYADCIKGDFCVSSEGWQAEAQRAFNDALKGTSLAGAVSVVLRESPIASDRFLDALLVALYETTQEACSDGEFVECTQNIRVGQARYGGGFGGGFGGGYGLPQGYGAYPYPQGGYGSSYYPGSRGLQGFPGFTGGFNSQCNFGRGMQDICGKFFNADARFRAERRSQRLPTIAGTQFGTTFCSLAIMQALGSMGPGKRPIYNPVLGSGVGGGSALGSQFFLEPAVQEARKRLAGQVPPKVEPLPYLGATIDPDRGAVPLVLPWRKAGENGGLVFEIYTLNSTGIGRGGTYGPGGCDNCTTDLTPNFLERFLGRVLGSTPATSASLEGSPAASLQGSIQAGQAGAGAASPAKPYPYLDCSSGGCSVKYDRDQVLGPVLATINKYKPVAHPDVEQPDGLGVLTEWRTAVPATASDQFPATDATKIKVYTGNRAYACAPATVTGDRVSFEPARYQLARDPQPSQGTLVKCAATNLLADGRFTVKPTQSNYNPTNPITDQPVTITAGEPASGGVVLDANPFYVLAASAAADAPTAVLPELLTAGVHTIAKLEADIGRLATATGLRIATTTDARRTYNWDQFFPPETATSGQAEAGQKPNDELITPLCTAYDELVGRTRQTPGALVTVGQSAATLAQDKPEFDPVPALLLQSVGSVSGSSATSAQRTRNLLFYTKTEGTTRTEVCRTRAELRRISVPADQIEGLVPSLAQVRTVVKRLGDGLAYAALAKRALVVGAAKRRLDGLHTADVESDAQNVGDLITTEVLPKFRTPLELESVRQSEDTALSSVGQASSGVLTKATELAFFQISQQALDELKVVYYGQANAIVLPQTKEFLFYIKAPVIGKVLSTSDFAGAKVQVGVGKDWGWNNLKDILLYYLKDDHAASSLASFFTAQRNCGIAYVDDVMPAKPELHVTVMCVGESGTPGLRRDRAELGAFLRFAEKPAEVTSQRFEASRGAQQPSGGSR